MRPLRISVTADPELPVPPKHYGGIERVVDMLVHGLVERGHEVTLFAHPDSNVPCRLEAYTRRRSQSFPDLLLNMWDVSSRVMRGRYDMVHSFGRLAYLFPLLPMKTAKLMTYQRLITPRSVAWGERLARRGSLHFTAVSRHIGKAFEGQQNWHIVYNGAPRSRYTFRKHVEGDAPLVFLGRIEYIKGTHLAIEIAKQTGRKLIIAGNVPDGPKHLAYFQQKVAPFLDGERITYVGPVDDLQKNTLLGSAFAFLMPILWDDPCPVVMGEALACGTPIVGLRRGAVPEVIENGITGFVCDTVEQMVRAVNSVGDIDRSTCRRIMEERFSDQSVVDGYERIYRVMLEK